MNIEKEAFKEIKRYIKEACNPFDYPINEPHLKIIEQAIDVLDILTRFIKSGSNDLFEWCQDYDNANRTNISKLINDYMMQSYNKVNNLESDC